MGAPLLPLDLLHALPVATWHRFFAAFGYPADLSRVATSHDAIAVALDRPAAGATSPVPPALRARLTELRELAPWPGREAIYDAATVRGVDTSAWPHELGDAELAAWLILARDQEPVLDHVLRMAHLDLRQTTRPRPFRLFVGKPPPEARPRVPTAEDLAELVADVDAWGRARGRSWRTTARACVDPDGPAITVVELCRIGAPRPRLAVGREPVRAGTPSDALSADVIRYDAARDRVAIATPESRLLPLFRRRVGILFAGDPEHFRDGPMVNLTVLAERGAEALDVPALRASVTRARLIRVVWEKGRMTRTLEGPDIFEDLAEEGESLAGVRLVSATIRLTLAAGGSVDAYLRIPNRVHVEATPHEAVVEAFLEASGLVGGRPLPSDLWSLAGVEARATCEALVGAGAFARLASEGVFVRTQSRAVPHPDHPHAGRPLITFPYEDQHFGVSEDPDVLSALLAPEALEMWRLSPVRSGGSSPARWGSRGRRARCRRSRGSSISASDIWGRC